MAKEYKEMIESSEVKNQAELARIKCISSARVTQILNLLKLDKATIDNLEKIGNPLESQIITKRMLRQYVNKSFREQKFFLDILKTLFPLSP